MRLYREKILSLEENIFWWEIELFEFGRIAKAAERDLSVAAGKRFFSKKAFRKDSTC
jgi:hypothetical protein